jgi:hypothetical protein
LSSQLPHTGENINVCLSLESRKSLDGGEGKAAESPGKIQEGEQEAVYWEAPVSEQRD